MKMKRKTEKELEIENEKLADETTELENKLERWKKACMRARTPYGITMTVDVSIKVPIPVPVINIDFDILNNDCTFKDPKNG